jgi:hypothetical protein
LTEFGRNGQFGVSVTPPVAKEANQEIEFAHYVKMAAETVTETETNLKNAEPKLNVQVIQAQTHLMYTNNIEPSSKNALF